MKRAWLPRLRSIGNRWPRSGLSSVRRCGHPPRMKAATARSFFRGWNASRSRAWAILGVTPELYYLPWPAGCDLLAVDRSRAMIDGVWPGAAAQAVEGDWLRMPLAPASRDLVVCDGGLILLRFPGEHEMLIEKLHEIIPSGGRCVFRLFVPPAERESVEEIIAALRAGQIANLNILKLRLAMALQPSTAEGVAVRMSCASWKAWRRAWSASRKNCAGPSSTCA